MRKLYLLFIFIFIFIFIFLSSCDFYDGRKPVDQDNSTWVSNEFLMFFVTDKSEHMGTIGIWFTDDINVNIKFDFGHGRDVFTYDVSKFIIRERDGAIYVNEALLFEGECTFGKSKFTITITRSEIDSIKVGDVITFNRVGELPGWAINMKESEDE